MKRIGLLFVSLLLLIGNVSAQDIMVVTKKDGTKTTFSIGSVHEVTFISSEDIDVSVNEIIPTSTTSFIVNYSVSTAGKINESGIYYGLDETASARKVIGELVNGKGSVEVTGLNFSTTYYIKAYAAYLFHQKIPAQIWTGMMFFFTRSASWSSSRSPAAYQPSARQPAPD